MTDPEPAGLEALAGVPRLALDEDSLDRLELALGGALPVEAVVPGVAGASRQGGPELVLTDAENTPLAHVAVGPGGARLSALRPLARGGGPHWDADLRRPASAVSAELGGQDGRVLAVVVDVPPANDDESPVRAAIGRAPVAAVLCVVPVARRHPGAGRISWAGLTRAAAELAATLGTEATPRIVPLVVPWPHDGQAARAGGRSLPDVLVAYGAAETVILSDLRNPAVAAKLAGVPGAIEREDLASYPPASAEAVLRAARATTPAGAVIFFTGLSGSGKSTIARALADEIADVDGRRVTLLDGDEVRQVLSAGLGSDAAARAANIERIAYVAALVAAHGGIAIAAPIAPFAAGRRQARELAERHGPFVLVHVSTPLAVCEARDRKGLYARARAGEIADFTGISSPYEIPADAEVVIDTSRLDVDDAVQLVHTALRAKLAEAADRPT